MRTSPDLQHTDQHIVDLHNKVAEASTKAGHPVQTSDVRPDPVQHLENVARAVQGMTKDQVRIVTGYFEEKTSGESHLTHAGAVQSKDPISLIRERLKRKNLNLEEKQAA